MRKEIKFLSTDEGIICVGHMILTEKEAAKVEQNKNKLENAAKDLAVGFYYGNSVCETRLSIGISPTIKEVEASIDAMKDVINNMGKIVKELPELEEQHDIPAEDPETKELSAIGDKFFNEFKEKFPKGAISMIMVNQKNNDCMVCGDMPKSIASIILLESHVK